MKNNFENMLLGKVALVTSSTRGIGLEIAKTLAACQAKVYLAVRNLEHGKEVAKEINANGGNADVVYFDASKQETFTSMVDEVVLKEGKIDILVNNFGHTNVQKDIDLLRTNGQDFMEIVNTNIATVFYPTQAAIKSMVEKGIKGSIINISSVGGKLPDVARIAYTTSKTAVNALTQNIATQYARFGIRVNAIMPGLIATDSAMNNMSQEFIDGFLKNIPLNRLGQSEDIANLTAFLASDLSSYITGELISVSGGFGMATPLYGWYSNMKKPG